MGNAARLDLASRRNEARVITLRFVGVDLSGAVMRQQVRQENDTPGTPLVDLTTVTAPNAQGIRLLSVEQVKGVPTSTVMIRYNMTTMRDVVPYKGELGDDSRFVHGFQIDGATVLYGDWWALASAIDSDNAPGSRPFGYGSQVHAPQPFSVAELTYVGQEIYEIHIDGGALLAGALALAQEAAASARLVPGRDPLAAVRARINEASLGGFTISNGDVLVSKPFLVVASMMNSLGVGEGAQYLDCPGEIFCDEFRKALPWVEIYHDNYSIPGAWFANYESMMIDDKAQDAIGGRLGIRRAHEAAMAPGGDGRRRMPDIVLMGTPSNDSFPNLFNAAQPPHAFNDISGHLIDRLTGPEFGAMVVGYNGPMYDVKRALLLGEGGGIPRMVLGSSFTMLWPFNGFYGFDNTNIYVYDAVAQTITSLIPGIFKQGLFDNNLLTADGRSWLWVDEYNRMMRIVGRDEAGSVLTVDDGNGGPAISDNRTSVRGVRQGNFDNKRQVIPIRNNDDFSRPASAPANAPLAIESRPFGPNGEYVHLSTRLTILNQIWEKNLARRGCYLVDWVGEQSKITTSDEVLVAQYPTDEIHPGGPLYQLTRPGAREIVRRIAYGIRGARI